jgi:hypothetical protein
MPTGTYKSADSNIPKLTENDYPMREDKVQQVIKGADAYDMITREEPEPEGNTREGCTELQNWI